jgi:hypothetical protein
MSMPLGSASPTLACRAVNARWPELLADVEKLGDGENEAAIVMLMQWVDLATAALAKTPPPTLPRRSSDGRREPERPAHAAANSLYRHTHEATAAIAARTAGTPARTATEMEQWQRRVEQILGEFQAMMSRDHSSQCPLQTRPSTSTTAAGMPTKQFSAQQSVTAMAAAAPVQAGLLSPPPVVVHATAVVVEDSCPTAVQPAEGCVGRLFRMLTRRPSDRPQQEHRSPSVQQPCHPLSAVQLHGQLPDAYLSRTPSSYRQSAVQDALLPLTSTAARG